MSVNISLADIGSGFNRSIINENFAAIQEAFEETLGRKGVIPNSMLADIDLNSNDLLNVRDITTQRLFVDGQEFVSSDVSAVGDKGWSPSFAIVTDGARRVLQLVAYVGGTGDVPTDGIGLYVGATGMVSNVANGVDIRGPQGASGAGTGDMLAAQNLNDVASKPTAFANIKQSATESATGVVELATTVEAAAGVDTTRAVTPAGLTAFRNAQAQPAEILLGTALVGSVPNLSLDLSAFTGFRHLRFVLTGYRPTSNNSDLYLRFSGDGGASYDSGASDYIYSNAISYSTNQSTTSSRSGSSIQMEGSISSSAPYSLDLDIIMYNWQSTTTYTKVAGQFIKSGVSNSFPVISLGRIGGYRNNLQYNSAVRFVPSSGNIAVVEYSIYGIR